MMKLKTIVAVMLIALGIVAFAYQGIAYMKRGREVSLGTAPTATERPFHIPLPPIFGAIALIGGIAMLLADKQTSSTRPRRDEHIFER